VSEGDEWKVAKRKTRAPAHSATIALTGDIAERARVISPNPTEWPKVGCVIVVRHNEDQQTAFMVTSIGPVAEKMLAMATGTVRVTGQVKASKGKLEVFATDFERAGAAGRPQSGFFSVFGIPEPPPEESDDE
jgi:hypothetical protein